MLLLLLESQQTDAINLGSISGVVGTTFVIVEVLKAYIKPTTKYLGKIPTWMFPIVISIALALLANKVIMLSPGHPALAGNTWIVVGRAFLAAASASGVFSMIKNRTTSIGESQPLTNPPKSLGEDNTMRPS